AQHRARVRREAHGAEGAEVDRDEPDRDALADHGAPFTVVELRADAEDAELVMAGARDALVRLAEQHVEQVLRAEALAGAVDAREQLLYGNGGVEGRRRFEAVVAVAAPPLRRVFLAEIGEQPGAPAAGGLGQAE